MIMFMQLTAQGCKLECSYWSLQEGCKASNRSLGRMMMKWVGHAHRHCPCSFVLHTPGSTKAAHDPAEGA